MSREIKFRAWCPATKIMGEVGKLFWNGDVHVQYRDPDLYQKEKGMNIAFPGYVGADWRKCDHLLMQFTGLKDKNGKDIWGSDIIQDLLTKVKYKVKFGYCKKYGFNGWYVENEELGIISALNGDYDTDQNSQIEIIGNIYEHPELLNQQVAS